MKTGGGFTYYKKYRPEKEVPGRHPLNWRVQFPDLAFKSVMKGISTCILLVKQILIFTTRGMKNHEI